MLIRHTILYGLSKLLPGAVGFATTAVLTRLFSPEEYGIYGLGLAAVVLTNSSVFEWLGLSLMRFYGASENRKRLLSTTVGLFSANCAVASAISAIMLLSSLASSHSSLIVVSCFASWTYAWFELNLKVLMAGLRPATYLWMNVTRAVGVFCTAIGVVLAGGGAVAVLGGSALTMLLVSLLYMRSEIPLRPLDMDRRDARILLQQGLPLIVGLSLGGIALVADRILLQAMAGSAIVGFYSAGWLITANSIQLLASGIGSATYPLAVKAFESGNTENAKQQLTSNMIILVGVLLPAGVGLACIAPNLAYLVVGASFVDPVSRLTPWLAASAVVGGVRSNYFDHAFHLTRKTHRLIAVMVTLASTNIVLNLLWIPAYGIVGAGAASLASASIALVHAIVSGLACYRLPVPLWPLSKIALSAGLMAITLDLLPMDPGPATLAIQLGVGVAVYSGALFVLNVGNLREILTTRRMR